jgi:hypothetical protein
MGKIENKKKRAESGWLDELARRHLTFTSIPNSPHQRLL